MTPAPAPLQALLGPEFRPCHALTSKPPGTFRIVVTGDSYAYGLGVRAAETLPAQLGERLSRARRSRDVEVINLGCPGLNLFNEWALVRQILDLVEHDALLLILSRDDAIAWSRAELDEMHRDWRSLWERQWHPNADVLPYALSALGSLVREVRERGRCIAVAFYEPVAPSGPRAMAIIRAACETLDAPFIDLVSPFERFAPDRIVVSDVDSHPNSLAHRVAVTEVERVLGPILPPESETSDETREVELCARLDALDEAGADTTMVINELRALPSAPPDEVLRLRRAHDALLRVSLLLENARRAEAQIGLLGATLSLLERELLLASLAVPGTEQCIDVSGALSEMTTAAARIPTWCDADETDLPPLVSARTSTAQVRRLTERVTRSKCERAHDARHLFASVGLLSDAARALALRNAERPLARPNAVLLAREATAAFDDLARACTLPLQVAQAAAIVVEAAVDAPSDVDHASLIGTFEAIFPARREFQQIHYLRRDGRFSTCWFDLPTGTIGSFRAYVKLWRGASESIDARAMLRQQLVVGSGARSYEGELFMVPA
jgi:hypothetical protein